jgi:hypothetical protein
MGLMERTDVVRWIEAYERAWRSPGTDQLAMVFSPDVRYQTSPWDEPVTGLDDLARLWEHERAGPDEGFTMESEIVALEGRTAVVRVAVDYEDPAVGRWRDLWVLQFTAGGRCAVFEEWPFAPGSDDTVVTGDVAR